ncbi:MAG TPA: DNA methylase N-4 [Pseudohongiella sp.]|nr:DNA methylase N-4 [Gammaproteobacteria bacterium]HBN15861.1 DNA methylase N-4 [Pseudohongiella sp.]
MKLSYPEFLRRKTAIADTAGFDVELTDINPLLKQHQKLMVKWACKGGLRALFAAFGLGKSVMQLEIVRLCMQHGSGRGMIILPLGVRQEFTRDAHILGTGDHPDITDAQRLQLQEWIERGGTVPQVKFIRRAEEIDQNPAVIHMTNYETVRDGKLDPTLFDVVSLDEASILRGFGGTKTFREFMAVLAGDDKRDMNRRVRSDGVPYRFVATATPSPNEYIELLAYAAFLNIMDVGQAKTRFFKRDSTKADKLTLHPHKEEEFWLWVASWALFVQKPSDLGCSDEGYDMPALDVRWHEIPDEHENAGTGHNGQMLMFKEQAIGVVESAREKRESLPRRIDKLMEIRAEDPAAHRIIWHDLEAERHAIEQAIDTVVSVFGSQDLDDREQTIIEFSNGKHQELAAKPSIAGSGCNFQRHCHWAVFLGIGFKFNDFIQAIHRIQRFLQKKQCRIDIIYTEAERQVRATLEEKWRNHVIQVEKMTAIIKKHGLSDAGKLEAMTRKLGVERVEVSGENYTAVNEDCVLETGRMDDNSVGLILTSIPFSTQYEYSPNYADFGHTDHNEHFFEQMDYLTPNLFRVLQPGRLCVVHVKDRIVPMGMTEYGCQTVYPLHMVATQHYIKHGFAYMGMKTITTDVVRENNQTYRLGWTEQCKDGTKMGVGMPEYLLIFRKPPTDTSNAYADVPVVKTKEDYSVGRWQIDAHGYTRSSGNRKLTPEELENMPHDQIFKWFRQYSLANVYDFEYHVRIADDLRKLERLPSTFMLLQPPSWADDVWTDVARMLTLNGTQSARGREMHLCPMQFDIADRVIEQMSNPGDLVLDPFGGIMTVPYRAVLKGRRGYGIELSPRYFADGCLYLKEAEEKTSTPDLFATLDSREAAA